MSELMLLIWERWVFSSSLSSSSRWAFFMASMAVQERKEDITDHQVFLSLQHAGAAVTQRAPKHVSATGLLARLFPPFPYNQ